MSHTESITKAKVEVRTIRSTQPDDIATITVDGDETELFETNRNPTLKTSRNKTGTVVEAKWPSEFAYGIDENGSLTDKSTHTKTRRENEPQSPW